MHKKIPITITINIEIDVDDGEGEGEQGLTPIAAGVYPLFQPAPDMPNYPAYSKLARQNGKRPLSIQAFRELRDEYVRRVESGLAAYDLADTLYLNQWKEQQGESNDGPRD